MASRRLRLIQRRKALGLTQEQLAEHARVDRSTAGRWERGESEPQPWQRPRLARTLQVPVEQLDDLLTPTDLDDTGNADGLDDRGDQRQRSILDRDHATLRGRVQATSDASEDDALTSIGPGLLNLPGDGAAEKLRDLLLNAAAVDAIQPLPPLTPSPHAVLPKTRPDTVVARLQIDGREVVMRLSRRLLLQVGVGSFVEAFALAQQLDMLSDLAQRGQVDRVVVTSPAHLDEVVAHLGEQWHALVRTDNLLGPRFALAGVLNQLSVVEALRSVLRDGRRLEVVRLGAQYAESAAWLYEEAGNMPQARYWTSRAMEWAYEGDDERMLAWTIFRRSQQAAATADAPQAIGLAQAARRDEERLATPTRAAIRVQEACGHALDGNKRASQQLLDEAHTWAASDTVGDAHEGHGSYCTPGHIEIQRASCWLTTGKPKKAIRLFEDAVRTLPPVYQRNRAAALSRLAMAYLIDGQLEQAAGTAHAALPVAKSSGARRILEEIKGVSAKLTPHRDLQPVAALQDDLRSEDA